MSVNLKLNFDIERGCKLSCLSNKAHGDTKSVHVSGQSTFCSRKVRITVKTERTNKVTIFVQRKEYGRINFGNHFLVLQWFGWC
jgi:hypothetical protein